MTKKIKFGSVIILVALATWVFFTPHIAALNMRKAAEHRDADKLAAYVDFPALKENLKGQINAKFASDIANTQKNNPYAGLGMVLAAAFVSPMIDALVTPENLRQMMRGDKPSITDSGSKPEPVAGQSAEDIETRMYYSGVDKFMISVRQKKSPEEITFVLNRDGLISWKLVAIRLPL